MSKYSESGVDTNKNELVVNNISHLVRSTYTNEMMNDPNCLFGNYSGLFPMGDYYLSATMDGVGTKSELVKKHLEYNGFIVLGYDIVNHCVNDTLAGGGIPLFFLDYYASSNLNINFVENFIKGVSISSKEAGVVLLGGETAEMPNIYKDGCCDLVGCMVGYRLKDEIRLERSNSIKIDDLIIGFHSSGPHTNGYSSIRKAITENEFNNLNAEEQEDFLNVSCNYHLSYLNTINVLRNNGIKIKAHIHITGGGWVDNPPRVIPDNLICKFKFNEWYEKMPKYWKTLKNITNMDWNEMLNVFNCGIGYMIVIEENDYDKMRTLDYFNKNIEDITRRYEYIGNFDFRNMVNTDNKVLFD